MSEACANVVEEMMVLLIGIPGCPAACPATCVISSVGWPLNRQRFH